MCSLSDRPCRPFIAVGTEGGAGATSRAAQRTITRRPILPEDCANAICWLASDASAKTTGHVIPIDGGLPEAFVR